MPGIDENLDFKPVTVAVLTVSDTRTRADDTSEPSCKTGWMIQKLTS